MVQCTTQDTYDWFKKVPERFYVSGKGREPVREWLKTLDSLERKRIGLDIATVEYGWPVGMPLSRSLGNGLFEIRTDLSGGRIARVFFTVAYKELVLRHGMIKKTRKTPVRDLLLARKRLKDV